MIRMLELEENVGDHLHQEEKKGGRMLAARDLEMLLGAGDLIEGVGTTCTTTRKILNLEEGVGC